MTPLNDVRLEQLSQKIAWQQGYDRAARVEVQKAKNDDYDHHPLRRGRTGMTFEVFTGRYKWLSRDSSPRVTLGVKRSFYMNHAAFVLIGEPAYAVLLYDSGTGGIAIRPATEMTVHAYPVRKQPNARSYIIAAAAFCNHYHINGLPQTFSASIEDELLILTPREP